MNINAKNSEATLRFVSFNVNGAKTIFQYHPWNTFSSDYERVFEQFRGDVISLQELKLTPSNISSIEIGHLKNFRSFISVPKYKRGYSGVGLFVRKPSSGSLRSVRNSLQVIKAEEGLTGYLNSPDVPGKCYIELKASESIGGYPVLEKSEALKIDSEGRCVVIELACNLVVFSVYCPANSVSTEDGENFRLQFLRTLLERCRKLKRDLGKEVVVMGDINVSLDMIDHADYMNDQLKQSMITPCLEGLEFEKKNYSKCIEFKFSTPARALLNDFVVSYLSSDQPSDNKILYDSTRHFIGRKMNTYTVWNARTGARQSNYGSRIDLILASSEQMIKGISSSGIWASVLGSDHCPVYTDFESTCFDINDNEIALPRKLSFEAQNFYKLVKHQDISSLFSRAPNIKEAAQKIPASVKGKSRVNKVQKPTSSVKQKEQRNQRRINEFFTKLKSDEKHKVEENSLFVSDTDDTPSNNFRSRELSILGLAEQLYGKPPKCLHGKSCQLKTSMANKKTRGKKYWCCAEPADSKISINSKCDFFQWATGKRG